MDPVTPYENETEQDNAIQGDMAEARKILFEVFGSDRHNEAALLTGSVTAIVEAMMTFASSLHTENVRLKEALEHLVHLHLCEQEGLQSGKPTPEMWLEAVDIASKALSTSPLNDVESK